MTNYKNRKMVSEFLTKNQMVQKIFENEEVAIAVTDKNSTIELINPEFTRLFGYTVKEAVGKSVNDLIIHEDKGGKLGRSSSKYKGKNGMEIIRNKKSGEKINVFSNVTPIMTGNEAIGGFALYRALNH